MPTHDNGDGFMSARLKVFNWSYGFLSLLSAVLIMMFLLNDILGFWIIHMILSSCFSSNPRLMHSDPLSFSTLVFSEILLFIIVVLMAFLVIQIILKSRMGSEEFSGGRKLFSLWYSDVMFLIKDPHLFLSYLLVSTLVVLLFNGAMLSVSPSLDLARIICPDPPNGSLDPSLSDNVQLLAILLDVTLGVGLPLVLNQLLPVFFHSRRELLVWHEGTSIDEALSDLDDHVIIVGSGKLGRITTRLLLAWRPVPDRLLATRYRIASGGGKGDYSPPWFLVPYLGKLVVIDRSVLGPYYKELGEDFSIGVEDISLTFGKKEEFIGARGDLGKEIVQEILRPHHASLIINTSGDEETHRELEEIAISSTKTNLITRVYNINWPGTSKLWLGMLKLDVNRDGVFFSMGRRLPYLLSQEYLRGLEEMVVLDSRELVEDDEPN